MGRSNLRIPRVALVTLTLGAACGGDDGGGGGSGGGTNVSEQRIQSATHAYCAQSDKCGELYQESVDKCVEEYNDYLDRATQADGNECADAILDYFECYADLACDSDEVCDELYAAMVKDCPSLDFDDG